MNVMAGLRMAPMAALGMTAALAILTGCDNGPSAVAGQQQAAGTQMASAEAPAQSADLPREDHRKDPVKLMDGKPIWAASRRASAEDSAQRSFERNGEAFGATTLEQFVRRAHAFVEHPPAGVQTLKRANGDTLFYDPKGNVFAVADKTGAPRTMFKPDEGAAYWEQQKTREIQRAERRKSRADDDAA
jgi:pyocin large subunit-like protein